MNKAEEYYPIWAKENPDKIHSKTLFAEAYHQSRVNATSDDDLYTKVSSLVRELDSVTRQPVLTHRKIGKLSIQWFKNKLLKQ